MFIQEITSLLSPVFPGVTRPGGRGVPGCAGMGSGALGAGRNVNCCGIHAARVIVIHSYYTGNVCVERGV